MVKADPHMEREMPRVDELYTVVDLKRIKKYGIPAAVAGGVAAFFFTAKSFLNDYKDKGEEAMKNLNAQAAITETTQDMEKRGVGLSDYENEGWVKIDQDYKAKHPVEKMIKEGRLKENMPLTLIKNYGKDPSVMQRYRSGVFGGLTAEKIKSVYKECEDWMVIGLKYKDEKGYENNLALLYIKLNGSWTVGDAGGLRNL